MKHTDNLLVTKVLGLCLNKTSTVGELTKKIYGNDYAKNEIQIYKTLEFLITEELLKPVVNNGSLKYMVNVEKILSMLAKNKIITQINNSTFKIKEV